MQSMNSMRSIAGGLSIKIGWQKSGEQKKNKSKSIYHYNVRLLNFNDSPID